MKKMTVEFEQISLLLAEKYLSQVPKLQRKIDPKQVRKIVTAIKNGSWRTNGATIVFNENGELADGQHRLKALLEVGKPMTFLVVRGIPADDQTFHTIGDEKARRITDFIRTRHVNNVAAAISTYYGWKQGAWPSVHKSAQPIASILDLGAEWLLTIEDLFDESVQGGGRIVKTPSFCLFLKFFYTHIAPVKNIERLNEFFDRLYDGVKLTATDPVYKLRQRFLSLKPGTRISRVAGQAMIMKSLHLYLDRKDCGKLQYLPETEPFPELRVPKDKKGDD